MTDKKLIEEAARLVCGQPTDKGTAKCFSCSNHSCEKFRTISALVSNQWEPAKEAVSQFVGQLKSAIKLDAQTEQTINKLFRRNFK